MTLNNIGVLLKDVLIDLRACCAQARHRARNLLSPGSPTRKPQPSNFSTPPPFSKFGTESCPP